MAACPQDDVTVSESRAARGAPRSLLCVVPIGNRLVRMTTIAGTLLDSWTVYWSTANTSHGCHAPQTKLCNTAASIESRERPPPPTLDNGEAPTIHHMDSFHAFVEAFPASEEHIGRSVASTARHFAGRKLRAHPSSERQWVTGTSLSWLLAGEDGHVDGELYVGSKAEVSWP